MAKRRGSGDGSIYQLKSGRWMASITVSSGGGKQVRRTRRARTYAEARTRLKELQNEVSIGISTTRLTVGDHLDDWLQRQKSAGKKSPPTLANYAWAISKHLKPSFGAVRLDRLNPDQVDQMLNDMAAQGAAANTMMRVRAVLSMAMSDAVRRRIVEWNPVSVTEPPSGPKRPSRAMSTVQVRAFLKAVQDDRLEAMWLVGLMIGLRPGELCGLTWSDIDLDGEVIHIRRSRLHRPDGMRLGDPKTPYSVRTVDLPKRVVEGLRRHKALQAEERLAAVFWASPDLVFCDSGGTPLSRWRLARLLNDVTKRADLGAWQPRELRHTAISMMFDTGLSREMVADVVGHAPGSNMTAGTYRHQLRTSVPGAKTAMDALFRAESETG